MIAALLLFKTFFVLICVWMSLVLIHELGHVAGALIVGFRFNFIRIGPFQIDRSRKISWHWTWRALLNGMTGAGAVSRSKLRWRFCAYIVAGPVTNLVVAFCAFKIMPRNDSMGAAVGLAIFLGSTFMGVTNLLPVRAGTQMLDGLKIWILLFTRRRRDRLLLLLTFAADARKGDFQRFLTDGSVESSSLIRDGSDQQVVASLLGYFKAATAKDYELAGRCLENSLVAASSVSRDMRETLALEAARYQALRRNRADLARQWLDVERSEAVTAMRCLVEAYVLYREDEYELAERKTDQGLVIIDSLPEGAQRTSQQASLRNMKAALGKLRAGEADNGILLD